MEDSIPARRQPTHDLVVRTETDPVADANFFENGLDAAIWVVPIEFPHGSE